MNIGYKNLFFIILLNVSSLGAGYFDHEFAMINCFQNGSLFISGFIDGENAAWDVILNGTAKSNGITTTLKYFANSNDEKAVLDALKEIACAIKIPPTTISEYICMQLPKRIYKKLEEEKYYNFKFIVRCFQKMGNDSTLDENVRMLFKDVQSIQEVYDIIPQEEKTIPSLASSSETFVHPSQYTLGVKTLLGGGVLAYGAAAFHSDRVPLPVSMRKYKKKVNWPHYITICGTTFVVGMVVGKVISS